ncbi:MAG: peptidyl-prolyl cis-trans isomerase [Sedimentisphaerales bacterium]|nr:peptidyl-prolyl cis-trans isomerase [Sedimentisphaerales bacterium]
MEEKLDFSLPEKKQKNSLIPKISFLLLLVLIGLTLVNLLKPSYKRPLSKNSAPLLSEEKVKDLATKLASRNLHIRAARVWQDYLSLAKVPDTERAKALFQVGILLEKAGLYEEAIEYYYRSELTAKLSEFESQINIHVKDCFERIGKFSALRYELMDRTSFKKSEDAGGKVVAEIGAEKITESDLDAVIERTIDNQLAPMMAFMTAEQLNEQKKKILEQYKNPSAKQEFLQSWLSQEVLYRQALEEKLSEQPEAKGLIEDLVRSALSQQLMNKELADKINITETDLQTYYQANKGRYLEPAKASISHILVKDQQRADDLIESIKNGEDFGELAKEFSEDQNTKNNAGIIDAEVRKGSYISGIGEFPELNDKIFTAGVGEVLSEPFMTEKGWEIIKVREKYPERQKIFDEVRQQVITALLSQKRQDVQMDLIEQMMNKYNVIIHTSAITNTDETETEEPAPGTVNE